SLNDVTAPPCLFALSSSSATFNNQGGAGTFAVRTANACTWTVTTNDSWVVFTGATSGSGDANVPFAVAANDGASNRNATLNVSGEWFTVSQAGVPPPVQVCTYAASTSSDVFPPTGGTGTISVTAGNGCSWTATSLVSWILITSGRNGAGNGAVNYS